MSISAHYKKDGAVMNITAQACYRTMPFSHISFAFCLLIAIFLKLNIRVQALIILPKNVSIPAVLAFGDSIIDPGNNNGFQTPEHRYRPHDVTHQKPLDGFCPLGSICANSSKGWPSREHKRVSCDPV